MTAADLPCPCSLVFNAGVIKYRGEYVMVFRNDYGCDQAAYENGKRFAGTSIGIARSKNGIDGWRFDPQPLADSNDPAKDPEMKRLYDPRIIQIEDRHSIQLSYSRMERTCAYPPNLV